MNINVVSRDIISRVLHRINTTGDGLLVDPNIVTQPPAEQEAVIDEIISASAVQQVVRLDLTVSRSDVCCFGIDIAGGASRDDQSTGHFVRQK